MINTRTDTLFERVNKGKKYHNNFVTYTLEWTIHFNKNDKAVSSAKHTDMGGGGELTRSVINCGSIKALLTQVWASWIIQHTVTSPTLQKMVNSGKLTKGGTSTEVYANTKLISCLLLQMCGGTEPSLMPSSSVMVIFLWPWFFFCLFHLFLLYFCSDFIYCIFLHLWCDPELEKIKLKFSRLLHALFWELYSC